MKVRNEKKSKSTSRTWKMEYHVLIKETSQIWMHNKYTQPLRTRCEDPGYSGILSKDLGLNLHGASKPKKHSLLSKHLLLSKHIFLWIDSTITLTILNAPTTVESVDCAFLQVAFTSSDFIGSDFMIRSQMRGIWIRVLIMMPNNSLSLDDFFMVRKT